MYNVAVRVTRDLSKAAGSAYPSVVDSHSPAARLCKKKRYLKTKRAYRAAHLEQARLSNRLWARRNRKKKKITSGRWWLRNRARLLKKKRRYNVLHRAERRAYDVRYRAEHPGRYAARRTIQNAVRNKIIAIPRGCQTCGERWKLHAHHPDYRRPLVVVWLCAWCHSEADQRRTA